ncbi:hypothetical protein J7T55_004045 [Diaporthe amygdali]|uniref:uncharacterized protein n=1 Tax=Phomopsis amygdali TaxID=1214568 RepID=UPI0022FDBB8D|nr:uncharacterized protein J7T55_004045 [Diaporthe amygdali]KAJ0115876.1 hypothetical protein J7T55_004045 [Diaporthe amygdali]
MAANPPHASGPALPSSASASASAANGTIIGYDYSTNTYYHQPVPAATHGPSLDRPSSSTQNHADPYPTTSYSHHPQLPGHQDNDQTLSNTLANSHHHANIDHLIAPAPTRFGGAAKFTEEWDASQRGSSIINGPVPRRTDNMAGSIHRSNSFSGSTTGSALGGLDGHSSVQLSRNNTLKKRSSLRRASSMRRSGSRRSMKAGSVRSLALQSNPDEDELHSAFHCPVPTTGNPTEALANRFQEWRKVLKDLITYFKEIQTHYETKSKSLVKLANVLNNVHMPPGFLSSGGLDDAVQVLRNYNSQAIIEANKAREIEEDVILALTGLRSDLQLKIKEIKGLSGDFKNSVEKEMDTTARVVSTLQEVLGKSDLDSSLTTGKEDPYLLRLAVDRQLERQLDEENYLHQAYLNLENSGRELESIVVGEIQKSYNAYAGIMKRESEAAWTAIEELRVGPIAMPKDHEWASFVKRDDQFVDPNIPIRSSQHIHYPGKDHYACQEIRAGLLERKTKYVLSPTHLHEFKSADKTQSPVMSLYLPEQKLGSRSQVGGSSPKFILKGRQTGGVHRGHSWVFRAESFDTMMAWYEDIKALTEKTPQERSEFVRGHSRSFSRSSSRRSVSSDGVVDEDDDEPYSAHNSAAALGQPGSGYQQDVPRRPSPGGRFPSDLQVTAQRGLQAPLSPSSSSSQGFNDRQQHQPRNDSDIVAAAGALPGSSFEQHYPSTTAPPNDPGYGYGSTVQAPIEQSHARAAEASQEAQEDGINPYTSESVHTQDRSGLYDQHPATIIARQAQNEDNRTETLRMRRKSSHEAEWLGGGPVEAAAIPVVASRNEPQELNDRSGGVINTGVYMDGTLNNDKAVLAQDHHYLNLKQLPHTTVAPMPAEHTNNTAGYLSRPAPSERTESDATLSSQITVPTISNLHIPGEYPKASAN